MRRALVAAGALVLVALVVLAWQATRASDALNQARDEAHVLQQQLIDGDVDAARVSLARLDRETTSAREHTDGPLWWLAGHVPVVGRNVDAIHVAAEEIDRVTDEALPGIVDVADQIRLDTFRPSRGRMDLPAIAKVAPVLAKADGVFARASARVTEIDPESLIGPLQRPANDLRRLMTTSAAAASAADNAARLLPSMLGADGRTRRYLLMVNNNAEVRSIGGMPGSVAVIKTRGGRIQMGEQKAARKLIVRKPAARLTADERSVFPTTVATDMRDTGVVPEFPRAARLATSIAERVMDRTFDGAIGVDPVALALVLDGTGPVKLSDGTRLTAANAVDFLLNGVYVKYPSDGDKQDDVFESAARRIFDATISGRGSSQKIVQGLVRGVRGGHVMVWSDHDDEQSRLRSSGIADTTTGVPPSRPQVGVYISDAGSTKMGYYLSTQTIVQTTRCRDGIQDLQVTTRISSAAPPNVTSLGPSVVGPGLYTPPGSIDLVVRLFAPRGGSVRTMTMDGTPAPVTGGRIGERQVSSAVIRLGPGQSALMVFQVEGGKGQVGTPVLDATPGIRPSGNRVQGSSCT